MYRCDCEPINDKLEGQKAAAFGALHNHNHIFTFEFRPLIQFAIGALFEMRLLCVAHAAKWRFSR
jgi:hypothetical protein